MSWNYRVTKQKVGDDEEYAIREVYYRGDGAVQGWSADPDPVVADTFGGLIKTLRMITDAFDSPVLDIDNTECVGSEREDEE